MLSFSLTQAPALSLVEGVSMWS